jgi:pSer/pThr/pTyr-binding forkhead associated (FHA) protein
MGDQFLMLTGVSGVVEGEEYKIESGKSAVVGRSRSCDFSLRNCKRWVETENEENASSESSKTVSRKHFKVTVKDACHVEIEDLSSNGTFVDDKRVDRHIITDIQSQPHEIRMGASETFRMEWK